MNIAHFRSLALKGALVIAALACLLGISGTALRVFASSGCYNGICFAEFPITSTPNSGPRGIVPGPNGTWFTEFNGNKIGRFSSGAITEYPVPTANSVPVNIILGLDGNLWFTELNGNKIGRLNPSTGTITEYPTPTR